MTRPLLLSLAVLSSACGLTSPGGGTGTLFVTARLTSDGSFGGSTARVTVRQGTSTGEPVANAEVAIRGGSLGRTIIPYDVDRAQYRLEGFSWVEGFRLEVSRGQDLLDGSIEAPGQTLIVAPVANSTFRRADGQPLTIQWKDERNSPAAKQQLQLEKAKIDRLENAGVLGDRVDTADLVVGKEKIHLTRTNDVALAGGAAGSTLSASTDHEIEFTIE